MKMLFVDAAARLAGIAGAIAGWRPDEFWQATPAELAALIGALAGEAETAAASSTELRRLQEMFPDG